MVDLKKSRLNRLRQKYALAFYVLHYLHGMPVGCEFFKARTIADIPQQQRIKQEDELI